MNEINGMIFERNDITYIIIIIDRLVLCCHLSFLGFRNNFCKHLVHRFVLLIYGIRSVDLLTNIEIFGNDRRK